mmetsp:Transcript_1147/g.1764  ORF Transcript_1147/g.1764 Transcript_1147/m.1764 type:complete len:419 (-) Transcript_1147:58-1314(-)
MAENGAGAAYVRWCEATRCEVDPSVLTGLETKWGVVKASNSFSLLPLLLMAKDKAVKDRFVDNVVTLKVKGDKSRSSHLADANARVLAEFLPLCKSVKHVDLSGMGLSPAGAEQVVRAVSASKTLQTLNLSSNPGIFPVVENSELASAIQKCPTLIKLDLTNDQLGFTAVQKIRRCGCEQELQVVDAGNNVFEEVMNAVTHGVGTLFSIIGSAVLMSHAAAPGQPATTFWACLIYCASLVILFLSSTLLHAAFMHQTASVVLGLMDHAAIYFLIAGTYTPFCLISLANHPLGYYFAVWQWLLALIGILFCFVDMRVGVPLKTPIELTLYIGMGWMIGFAYEDVKDDISEAAFELLAAGGMAFTVGVLFFIMEKTHHPLGHAIWHVFVLVGAVCHYFAVLFYVVGIEEQVAVCDAFKTL